MPTAMIRRLSRRSCVAGLALALIPAFAAPLAAAPIDRGPANTDFTPALPGQTRADAVSSGVTLTETEIGGELEHPWGIAVLPSGDILVTERPGRMRVVGKDGTTGAPIAGVPEVMNDGQGGLLDVTLSPDFAADRMVYFTYAKPMGGGLAATAAARGRLSNDVTRLDGVQDIFVQTPPSPSPLHFGSRIVFALDGTVFVTTGEHFTEAERVFAQDLTKTYGKVIHLNADGSVPHGNPFVGRPDADPAVWSYGHRNVQGAAIDPASGQLWTIEHGPQGGDELNHPEAGKNYGWPVISYGENYDGTPVGSGKSAMQGMEQPIYYWDPVIAPSGMTFYDGTMFPEWQGDILVGSLNPGALVRLDLGGDAVKGEEEFLSGRGLRVRDVAVDPADGSILVVIDEDGSRLTRLTRPD
jgi:glucose/arabinose dehydrogenase